MVICGHEMVVFLIDEIINCICSWLQPDWLCSTVTIEEKAGVGIFVI